MDVSSTDETNAAQNSVLLRNRRALELEIKSVAALKLGSDPSLDSYLDLSNFEIENWPPFIPPYSEYWDNQSLIELKEKMALFSFKKLPKTERRYSLIDQYKSSILDLLLERLNTQTDEHVKFDSIPWNSYNLSGWPSCVSIFQDLWGFTEFLKIHRQLNDIEFKMLTSPCFPINAKLVGGKGIEISNASLKRKRTISTSSTQVNPSSKKLGEFETRCLDLKKNIETMAEIQTKQSRKLLSFYHIQNWPPFVSTNHEYWDVQAYNDLNAAYPNFVFSFRLNKTENDYVRNRSELIDLLLDRFKGQTGNTNATKAQMFCSNLKGWPQGVETRSNRWGCLDILKIFRNLNFIEFEPKPCKNKRLKATLSHVTNREKTFESLRKYYDYIGSNSFNGFGFQFDSNSNSELITKEMDPFMSHISSFIHSTDSDDHDHVDEILRVSTLDDELGVMDNNENLEAFSLNLD